MRAQAIITGQKAFYLNERVDEAGVPKIVQRVRYNGSALFFEATLFNGVMVQVELHAFPRLEIAIRDGYAYDIRKTGWPRTLRDDFIKDLFIEFDTFVRRHPNVVRRGDLPTPEKFQLELVPKEDY